MKLKFLAATLCGLAAMGAQAAGSASGSSAVTINHTAGCSNGSISVPSLTATYLAYQGTNATGSGNLKIDCSNNMTGLTVTLNGLASVTGAVASIPGPGNTLTYDVTQASAAPTLVGTASGGGTQYNWTLGLSVPNGQAGGATGAYTGTVAVAIAW